MPMKLVSPELFLKHAGIEIYHVYKDGFIDSAMSYFYTTDLTENPEFEFDVRMLDGPGSDREKIKRAIDAGKLRLPEGVEYV